jgi:transcription-repair coupling factor (superfamily II helicase)
MADQGQRMNLSCLLSLLKDVPAYTQLAGELSTAKGEHKAVILDAAKPYLIAALCAELSLPTMVVTAQPETARRLHEQLRAWCSPSVELHRLPELDFLPYDRSQVSTASYQMVERLRALATLALYEESGKPPLVVTSALAIMGKTVPHGDFAAACHILKPGMAVEPMELLRRWQGIGYEMEDIVELPGQMSRRGGIIDVFPPSSQSPVRIEFSGDQIETMRCFDPESQRSTSPISSLLVTPARELMRKGDGSELIAGSVLDYLGSDALLVLDDPEGIELAVARLNEETDELRAAKMERGELPEDLPSPYLTWEELESRIEEKRRLTLLNAISHQLSAASNGQAWPFVSAQSYGSQLEMFLKTAKQMVEQRQRVVVVSHQADRLAELLQKEDIHTAPTSQIEQMPPPGSITVLQGSLDGGWLLDGRLTIITDVELFGFVKQPRAVKKRPISHQWFLPQLARGDYVVHIDHGIARFHGLVRMSSGGVEREYLVLEYGMAEDQEQGQRIGGGNRSGAA